MAGPSPRPGAAAAAGRPGRGERPVLRPPREVPRREIGPGVAGRVALPHALAHIDLAHIELNAVDLSWDIVTRFADQGLPRGVQRRVLDALNESAPVAARSPPIALNRVMGGGHASYRFIFDEAILPWCKLP